VLLVLKDPKEFKGLPDHKDPKDQVEHREHRDRKA
jgi:hypothetical protein